MLHKRLVIVHIVLVLVAVRNSGKAGDSRLAGGSLSLEFWSLESGGDGRQQFISGFRS